ncbi:MAG: hypothetical protein DME59_12370 [Verrucomicrobia bacterium]|nr:MAG: hypothetical protein DME59_12370 [Verrucomicrobiota bacterium]
MAGLLLMALAAKPPPPTSTGFARAYSVPYSYSVAESVSQASSGSFVVGALCDQGACNGPATVLRVDSSGNIQSQTQYSYGTGPQSTALNIIKATSDGGALYAGQPQFGCPAQNLNSCGAIVKVDSSGNVQWANDLLFATTAPPPYSSPLTWPLDIQQTTDGGYVLVGYANAPSENYNPWIAKLTSRGQVQWTHVFAGPNNEYGYGLSVRQTSDGGFIVGGDANYVVSPSYTESEIAVFKLDSTGALVWQRNYAAGTGVYFDSFALTSDGGFIVSGSVDQQQTPTSYTSSVLLLKLDSTGNTQFARTYLPSGSISDLNIAGAQQTSDGGYAFAGYYFQNTIYDERAWMVKTDASGNVQWNKIYGPDVQYSDRYFHSFQQTSDGGFVAAGSTNEFNSGDNSLWLVKTDSNGNISNCADVHNDSAVTGSIAVTVSNGDLSAVTDGFSYVADSLILSSAPLAATRECH